MKHFEFEVFRIHIQNEPNTVSNFSVFFVFRSDKHCIVKPSEDYVLG